MQLFIKRASKPRVDWPANMQPIGDQILNHILYGDKNGKEGGRLYGRGIVGKKEFPQDWDVIRIEKAIAQTLHIPRWVKDPANEFRPTVFVVEIDGMQIEVKVYLYQGRYVIERAYPVGGDGVFKNLKNGDRIPVKRIRAREWKHE